MNKSLDSFLMVNKRNHNQMVQSLKDDMILSFDTKTNTLHATFKTDMFLSWFFNWQNEQDEYWNLNTKFDL